MIVRDKALIKDGLEAAFLISCLNEHAADTERYEKLLAAYKSRGTIMARKTPAGYPNNKLVHNYGRYIVAVAAGYLVGNPVTYQAEEGVLDALTEAYGKADIDSVDAELAKDAALLGKGVELCYADENALPRSAALEPEQAFVVYGNDVQNTPILGVRFYDVADMTGKKAYIEVEVYTDSERLTYRGKDFKEAVRSAPDREEHWFGRVPMVEYWNNDDETGDFEHVLSLIDAYDKLQSDRVNDKEQYVQAILLMTGARMQAEPDVIDEETGKVIKKGRTAAQQIREDRMLFLPDSDAKAEYLTRLMDESDTSILAKEIREAIHKFAMVPDLSDENFAGNVSGVAMKYKLFGLEQLTKIKERWFKEGLRQRLRLFCCFLSTKGAAVPDPDGIDIIFKRALPSNDAETAQMVSTLNGMVPHETLLAQLPFISDAAAAAETLKQEKVEAARRQQEAFGSPFAEREDE